MLFFDIFFEKLKLFQFLSYKNVLFFLNRSEFRQKLIGTIIRVLVRHLCA